jgi:hypothetical protein
LPEYRSAKEQKPIKYVDRRQHIVGRQKSPKARTSMGLRLSTDPGYFPRKVYTRLQHSQEGRKELGLIEERKGNLNLKKLF